MEIYLSKDGAQTGPFPLEEVQKMVSAGQSSTTDLCWHSELTEWVPLSCHSDSGARADRSSYSVGNHQAH